MARALQDREVGHGVIVFDESSRAIPHEALPAFYDMVRALAAQGTSVLMVSHNLHEVLELCDRVTVLRNGRVVESGVTTGDLTQADLTRMVLGRDHDLDDLIAQYPARPDAFEVRVNGVSGGLVRDVAVALHGGRSSASWGRPTRGPAPPAAARRSRPRPRRLDPGEPSGARPAHPRPRHFLQTGVAFIPQDRNREGLSGAESIEDNVTLPHLKNRGHVLWTGQRWRREETGHVLEKFDVQPPDRHARVGSLSGGNAQKVLFGKWLLGNPTLLVLDEPTQAVDVGARSALLLATRRAAADGAAVIYCSDEVDDLVAVCDRVVVLRDGRVAAEFTAPFDVDALLDSMFTSSEENTHGR